MKYKIAIVDDEKEWIDNLSALLTKYFKKAGREFSLSVFHNGEEIIAKYNDIYDVIFLDVEMEKMNGFQVAKKIREMDEHTQILFVTRHAKYSRYGYEVSAFDYFLKPVAYPILQQKMDRLMKYIERNREKYIVIQSEQNFVKILEEDIFYIESFRHNIVYHTKEGDFNEWSTLKQVESRLSKESFSYCNRSFLLNLRYVTGIKDNQAIINEQAFPIGRAKKKEFLEKVAMYLGGRY